MAARHQKYLRASRDGARASKKPTASCMPGPFGRRRRHGRGLYGGRPNMGSDALKALIAFARVYAEFDDEDKFALESIADGTFKSQDWELVENAIMEVQEHVDGIDYHKINDAMSDALEWAMEQDELEYEAGERKKGESLAEQDMRGYGYLSRTGKRRDG